MAGAECCVPSPPAEHSCVGKEEPVGPSLSYVVQAPSPTSAVVLVSDIFGFEAPLLRKLADKIAAAGYIVVVPDYFGKDIFVPGSTIIDDWLPKHRPEDAVENAKKTVEALQSKGFLSVGAVGFCWGAKVVAGLTKGDCLKAAVFCHPSFVTVKDIEDVKTPLAILAAEIDQMTPPALAKEFQGILESKAGVESFVHIYPGVSHGWTVRYDQNDKKAVEKAEEAHKKILEWFGKFLH